MNEDRLAYAFDVDRSEVAGDPLAVLGGKGAGLALMTAAGLPVPPGFTLTTGACRAVLAGGWPAELDRAIERELERLEGVLGKALGSPTAPLLVSVRSGAQVSMPGMMDTVLNVGMTPAVERSLADLTGDPDFAADTHRRALLGFAEIVLGAPREVLADASVTGTPADVAAALRTNGYEVPADPVAQVRDAVRVVFESWTAPRAVRYRAVEGIDDSVGTAATVQAMVFGNLGERSGTGVAFTRDPTSGERGLMGDFLVGAQGEDVVAGAPRHRAAGPDGPALAPPVPGAGAHRRPVGGPLPGHGRHRVHRRAGPPLAPAGAPGESAARSPRSGWPSSWPRTPGSPSTGPTPWPAASGTSTILPGSR